MRELAGPIERDRLPQIHRRRLADPWWFKIVAEPSGPAVGTIGVWETRHGDEDLHESMTDSFNTSPAATAHYVGHDDPYRTSQQSRRARHVAGRSRLGRGPALVEPRD